MTTPLELAHQALADRHPGFDDPEGIDLAVLEMGDVYRWCQTMLAREPLLAAEVVRLTEECDRLLSLLESER